MKASIADLEKEVDKIYVAFGEQIEADPTAAEVIDRVDQGHKETRERLETMEASCSLDHMIPEVSTAHLKNIWCLPIRCTGWQHPGYYKDQGYQIWGGWREPKLRQSRHILVQYGQTSGLHLLP